MISIYVKVINLSPSLELPVYKTKGSSGFDLRCCFDSVDPNTKTVLYEAYPARRGKHELPVNVEDKIVLTPGSRLMISTGLKMEIPLGFELQIRPRSGLAIKNGITIINTPGTIDSDYRGEIFMEVFNNGFEDFVIYHGMRLAQGVLTNYYQASFEEVTVLEETERADQGIGHTGTK